jgi:hypothetical protein
MSSPAITCNQTVDEDGNEIYEFRDLLDRVILTRSMDGTMHYSTYYVYDESVSKGIYACSSPLAADAFEVP